MEKDKLVEAFKTIINFVFESYPYIGRIIIAFSISIFLYIWLGFKLKNSQSIRNIFFSKLKHDFFYPIFILLSLFLIEMFFKTEKIFSFDHYFYELIPIYLTFIFYYFFEIRNEYKKEKKKEDIFWSDYKEQLNSANTIKALNVRDYSNFFIPLGMRYFAEQLKLRKTQPFLKNDTELNNFKDSITLNNQVQISRFVVISANSASELISTEEIKSTLESDGLNDKQRIFYNIFSLHKHHHINLYLIPDKEIKEFILQKYNKRYQYFMRQNVFRKLDKLFINNQCYEVTDKKNTLLFKKENNQELIDLINEVFTKFENENYCAYTLKEKKVKSTYD